LTRLSDPPLDRSEAVYEIVELTEELAIQPVLLGAGDELGGSPSIPSDMHPANVRDPLYQAFVATGFLRPR